MDIAAIDYWANSGAGPLHRSSALGKGAAAAAFIAAVVLATSPFLLAAVYLLLLAGVFVSRLPARRLVVIAAYPTIFALLFAISRWNGGWAEPTVVILKAVTAAQAMVLLITTTPYPDIFAAANRFMPRLLADGLFVTYRSFFLLLKEMDRTVTALKLRGGLRPGRYVENAGNLARAIGMLLVRAMDLSERLYAVLRVRGYRGRMVPSSRWRSVSGADLLPLSAGLLAVALALVSRLLPGLWAAVNGLVLVSSAVLVALAFASARRRVEPASRPGGDEARPLGELAARPGTVPGEEDGEMHAAIAGDVVKPVTPHGHHQPEAGHIVAKVSCVRHVYPDGTEVSLCGLDFVAHKNERVVVLGPNGAGKSTLLNHLLGLLRPAEGEVTVLGHDPAREFAAIQPRVGVLMQDVDEQLLGPTVADDVAFGARNAGHGDRSVEMALAAMELLGVTHLADKVPHYLSGGEKRKVALAGAIVTSPELLVLDEPFEGLDPRSRGELVDLLVRLQQEKGMTLILTTHHVDLLPELADTVYLLAEGGRIVARGTPNEVFARDNPMPETAIDPPTLSVLFRRLAEQGVDLGMPLNVDDAADRLLDRLREAKSDQRPATRSLRHTP